MDWKYFGELALSVAIFAPGLILLALWVLLRPFVGRRPEVAAAPTSAHDHDAGNAPHRGGPVGSGTPPVAARSPVRPVRTTLGDV